MRVGTARRSARARLLVVAASLLVLVAPSSFWDGARADVVQAEAGSDSRADDPHLDPWWYEAMGLDEGHPLATGKGVTIALLDDGLQQGVPALEGADIEFMRSPCLFERDILQREDGRRATWNEGDDGEHGTAMASLILGGGVGPDGPGSGIRGAAPDAKVLFFDIDEERQPNPEEDGGLRCDPADKADTYRAAVEAGADIISVSNGGVPDVHGPDAVAEVVASNRAVFVAANNDSSPFVYRSGKGLGIPGGAPGVISVNALDKDNVPWEESLTLWDRTPGSITFGWWAPSVSASGLDIDIAGGYQGAGPGTTIGGTSPATALVAGIMALVKERHPDATANQLVQHVIHYTTRFKKPRTMPDMTWANGSGFGLVGTPLMLDNDPTVWPDENPLLAQPDEIAERYPTSLRNTPPPADEGEPGSEETGAEAPDETQGAAEAVAGEPQAGTAEGDAQGNDAPVAGWVWPVGGVLVLLALLVAVLLRRRSSPAPAVTDADTDHDTDSRRASHGADTTGE